MAAIEKNIEAANLATPGQQCPFCGTNPSKIAKYGSGWKDFCGHEIRENDLVVAWAKDGKTVKCVNSEETQPLVFVDGAWR
jgi:endogenous inhibitor of DNA gyrase (YacG/DUF329 family)